MPQLKFYDIKAKESFKTDEYEVIEQEASNGRKMYFAVALSPAGNEVKRFVSKDFYKRFG